MVVTLPDRVVLASVAVRLTSGLVPPTMPENSTSRPVISKAPGPSTVWLKTASFTPRPIVVSPSRAVLFSVRLPVSVNTPCSAVLPAVCVRPASVKVSSAPLPKVALPVFSRFSGLVMAVVSPVNATS